MPYHLTLIPEAGEAYDALPGALQGVADGLFDDLRAEPTLSGRARHIDGVHSTYSYRSGDLLLVWMRDGGTVTVVVVETMVDATLRRRGFVENLLAERSARPDDPG